LERHAPYFANVLSLSSFRYWDKFTFRHNIGPGGDCGDQHPRCDLANELSGLHHLSPAAQRALTRVFADLNGAGIAAPTVSIEDAEADIPVTTGTARWSVTVHDPDEASLTFWLGLEEDPAVQQVVVADTIQSWVIQNLALSQQPAVWPRCPNHPGTHPLQAELRRDDAVWICPKNGAPICAIGELTRESPK
jgi:hypothetical protein